MLRVNRYECEDPPCLHVVVDFSRKYFAVFLETSDGDIIYVPFEKIEKAYTTAKKLLSSRFREATGSEIDDLAYEKLGAAPYEEE